MSDHYYYCYYYYYYCYCCYYFYLCFFYPRDGYAFLDHLNKRKRKVSSKVSLGRQGQN